MHLENERKKFHFGTVEWINCDQSEIRYFDFYGSYKSESFFNKNIKRHLFIDIYSFENEIMQPILELNCLCLSQKIHHKAFHYQKLKLNIF